MRVPLPARPGEVARASASHVRSDCPAARRRLRRPPGNHAVAGAAIERRRACGAPAPRGASWRTGARWVCWFRSAARAPALGEDLLDAAQLALFDVGRTDLELLPRDTGDQPQQAEAAARSALDAGAELLIGPLYGRSARSRGPGRGGARRQCASPSPTTPASRGPVSTCWASAPRSRSSGSCATRAAQGRTRFAALAPERRLWRPRARRLGAAPSPRCRAPRPRSPRPIRRQRQPEAEVEQRGRVRPAERAAARAPATDHPEFNAHPRWRSAPGFDAVLIADGGPARPCDRRFAGLLRHRSRDAWRCRARCAGRTIPMLLTDAGLQGAMLATWPPDACRLPAPVRARSMVASRRRWRCWPTTPPPWRCCWRRASRVSPGADHRSARVCRRRRNLPAAARRSGRAWLGRGRDRSGGGASARSGAAHVRRRAGQPLSRQAVLSVYCAAKSR